MGFLDNVKSALTGTQVNYNELIQAGAIVVDVRTEGEFQTGHVQGSKNIPLQSLDNHLKELQDNVVILVCRSGARAGQAKSILEHKGIEVYNAGAWQNI